jgi:hypothetical protein
MPKDVEPFQPVVGSPPCRAALGCKVKAQESRAFNSGEKPPLVTLRDHSPVKFFDSESRAGARESIVAEASGLSGVCDVPKAMRRA